MQFSDLAVGPDPQLPLEAFQRRRRAVAETLGDERVLVVATHAPSPYSNDVEHRFRPHSDFWYLTGFREPHAVLVLEGGTGATTLFLQPRKPEAEVWTGRRLGVERAVDALAVDRAHPIDELPRRLAGILEGRQILAVARHDPAALERIANAAGEADVEDGTPVTAAQRIRKDAAELEMLQRAADVGCTAMEEAARRIRPGGHEHEVEGALLGHYRSAGSTGPGYPPIVGTGPNAAVLHYIDNNAPIREGDLVLVDAGCEWGYYNSDITRTFPAGTTPEAARDLHALVLDAHAAALKEVRPGNPFHAPHDAASRVLAEGLVERGILEGDAATAIEEKTYRRHFMHGTSHLLGLDVHDVGPASREEVQGMRLEEGMVLTVEPGLYFNPDFAACPDGLAGIGIRIEDDVAVTQDGPRVLTEGLGRDWDAMQTLVGRS